MIRFLAALTSTLFFAGSLATNIIITDINTITVDVKAFKTTVSQFVTDPTSDKFEPIILQALAVGQVFEDAIGATNQPISDDDGQEIQTALEAALPVFTDAFSYLKDNESSFAHAGANYVALIAQGLNELHVYALRFGLALVTYVPCDLRSQVAQFATKLENAYESTISAYTT